MYFAIVLFCVFWIVRGFILGPFHESHFSNPYALWDLRFYLYYFDLSEKNKVRFGLLTQQQVDTMRAYARKKIEENPNVPIFPECYPDIVAEINAIRQYQELCENYRLGEIDKVTFELAVAELGDQVKLDHEVTRGK